MTDLHVAMDPHAKHRTEALALLEEIRADVEAGNVLDFTVVTVEPAGTTGIKSTGGQTSAQLGQLFVTMWRIAAEGWEK